MFSFQLLGGFETLPGLHAQGLIATRETRSGGHRPGGIRSLLRKLEQPVPVDLVKELGIAEPEEYIKHLRMRACTAVLP